MRPAMAAAFVMGEQPSVVEGPAAFDGSSASTMLPEMPAEVSWGPNAAAPGIMLTAYTYVRLITTARQCGADYVIAKPFSTQGLLERILYVAESEGRRGELIAPAGLVSATGSGVEMF